MPRPEAHRQPPAASQAVQVDHHPWRAEPLLFILQSGAAFHKLLNCSPQEGSDYNYNLEQEQPKRYLSTALSPPR